MSEQKTYHIRCPKCGAEQDVGLYDAINARTDPELREALIQNRLNAVTCTGCSLAFRVDKQVIYADPDRRMLVCWVPAKEEEYDRDEDRFIDLLKDLTAMLPDGLEAPQVSLVFSRTELVEKIFIREADLDERIIEYIKYTMYTKNPTKLDPTRKALLFNAHDSTDKLLLFIVQDVITQKLEAALQYERSGYVALTELFRGDEAMADLLELFPGPHISARRALLREFGEDEEEDGDDAAESADGASSESADDKDRED